MEKRIYDLDEVAWQAVRPDVARGVFGKGLIPEGGAGVKMVLNRVAPGGEFSSHRDPYHHLFHFLAGEGEGWIGTERYAIRPGRVVQVPAGEEHGYRNTGGEDLLLVTVNLPA